MKTRWLLTTGGAALCFILGAVHLRHLGSQSSGDFQKEKSVSPSRQAVPMTTHVRVPGAQRSTAPLSNAPHNRKDTFAARRGALMESIAAVNGARSNVIATPREALEDALARSDSLVEDVAALLMHLDEEVLVQSGPESADKLIRERMAAIDVLEIAAHEAVTGASSESAIAALRAIAAGHQQAPETLRGRQVTVSERLDAMTALARVRPEDAIRVWGDIPEKPQRDFFKTGILTAALDTGVEREHLEAYFAALQAKIDALPNRPASPQKL